jgi:hypothetical protein
MDSRNLPAIIAGGRELAPHAEALRQLGVTFVDGGGAAAVARAVPELLERRQDRRVDRASSPGA